MHARYARLEQNFARNILTSILTAFAGDGDEATSAEQRVINLIREWAELGPRDNQGSSVPSHFHPTTVRDRVEFTNGRIRA